ncbi:MAG: hypothetical protein IPN10_08650 [Saprospiraceae bacterium]|nr:hypothetical protein [Saprospiraceae bacterium]
MYLSKYIFILAGILMMAGCYPDAEESTEIIIKPVRKTIIASANVVINVTDEKRTDFDRSHCKIQQRKQDYQPGNSFSV